MSLLKSKLCRHFFGGFMVTILILLFIVHKIYIFMYTAYDITAIKYMSSVIIKTINIENNSNEQDDLISVGCDFHAPFDRLKQYQVLNVFFKRMRFNHNKTIEYIRNRSKTIYCTQTENAYVYNFSKKHPFKPNIAIATVIILPKNSINDKNTNNNDNNDDDEVEVNVFADIRTYHLKIANALHYCEINGYSLIVLFKPIFEYKYKGYKIKYATKDIVNHTKLKIEYETTMNSPKYQKPFLVEKYLSNYDWILFMDYDTMFTYCRRKIENFVIKKAYSIHSNHTNSDLISIIFSGEQYMTINSGVWLIKNNKWSHTFLSDWIYITKNAEKFQLLKTNMFVKDQTIFVALLEGFNVHKNITKDTYKEIKLKRDSTTRWYIERNIDIEVKYAYKYPIYDANLSKYAVAIDESLLNAKLYNYPPKKSHKTLIMHYYFGDKNKKASVFRTFERICTIKHIYS